MSSTRWFRPICAALALAAPYDAALAQARVLQHDPFSRPALGGLPNAQRGLPAAPAMRGEVPAPAPKLKLHAVLVAGPDSIANVDGVMVRVGDSVQGYRLVAVQDRSAVFEKNSARFTVHIGTQPGAQKQAPAKPQGGEAK